MSDRLKRAEQFKVSRLEQYDSYELECMEAFASQEVADTLAKVREYAEILTREMSRSIQNDEPSSNAIELSNCIARRSVSVDVGKKILEILDGIPDRKGDGVSGQ